MPILPNLKKVVILGSGPIVIGQACEFDYSGTQACKALIREGLDVILINSNPATIMTDPELATRVYIEPLEFEFVKKILEKEKPEALISTLGGQTALNLSLELAQKNVLKDLNIKLLGSKEKTIQMTEDREQFRKLLDSIGASFARSHLVRTYEEGLHFSEKLKFPLILRPNFTLGGGGGGVAYSLEEYRTKLATALHESPSSEVLVEESLLNWKEFELEIMRDRRGTFIVVCSIENLDPCGVHTGDSITVAPQQTLSDREYQDMRDEAKKIAEAVGVETGGANVQFAVHPYTRKRAVIEMNPRVSRSSALASKATGFPIAKVAALLAVGYTMDEILNDITGQTPSCYEPALDYVVTKIPRFDFQKFPQAKDVLSTQMKSIGEVMGLGRTFKESLCKAIHSLEREEMVLEKDFPVENVFLATPNSFRIFSVFQAFRENFSLKRVHSQTGISLWFLKQIQDLMQFESKLKKEKNLSRELMLEAKRNGFSDKHIGACFSKTGEEIRVLRWEKKIHPSYLRVDTCAGEFVAKTPYYYSTYWGQDSLKLKEPRRETSHRASLLILGSGPNRIGQGIEFDYSSVRGIQELRKENYFVIMVNSNPETVSTDYDTSNELYFEPLTEEHILEILNFTKPLGFISQLGGQTPIHLAPRLIATHFNMMGSSMETIDLAEDRGQFAKICKALKFKIPSSNLVSSLSEALQSVDVTGYPLICRPSYVLGGHRMEIVENKDELKSYFVRNKNFISKKHPCLMEQFLEQALEVDVDMVRGKDWSLIGGVLEHIEAAGVHSGDSMAVIPPQRLKDETLEKIEKLCLKLAERLGILGFLNLQLAVKEDEIYILEGNPRSSRSLPFISKATGLPLVNLGLLALMGYGKNEIQLESKSWKDSVQKVSVKGVVFPFKKFVGVDSILGPEMKSTGETMGRGEDYSEALAKALISSHYRLPLKGEVFLSLRDKDKEELLSFSKDIIRMGYTLSATKGTAKFLQEKGLVCEKVKKVQEGRPHCVDRIRSGAICFVVNTTSGHKSIEASHGIRRSCIDYSVPCLTESDAAKAFLVALKRYKQKEKYFNVEALMSCRMSVSCKSEV